MAKQIIYGEEARKALERGINQLADTHAQNPAPIAKTCKQPFFHYAT